MSDTNELQTTRLDGTIHDGEDLAAKWPNFEAALRHIFGIPADTAMSEAMQIGTGPNLTMTGTLTASGAPTSDLHASTRAYLQSQGSGMGAVRARAYLTSNYTYAASGVYLPFGSADINVGSVWSAGNPSRLTIPTTGDYLIGFSISFNPDAGEKNNFTAAIYKNRSAGIAQGMCVNYLDGTDTAGGSGMMYANDCTAGEYVELYIDGAENGVIETANTTFWIMSL